MRSFKPAPFAKVARAPAVLAGAVALILVALLPFSGCSLSSEGTGGPPGPPCARDLDCEDGNGCTQTYCGLAKTCVITAIPGAVPDDANACTVDHCDGVTAIHDPLADGTICSEGFGSGKCEAGDCNIVCNQLDAMTVCNDDEPCTIDSCDLAQGICARTKLDGGLSPGVLAVTGDCQVHVCVDGLSTRVIDDTDEPVDIACFEEACVDGLPDTEPSPVETPCGDGLICDGLGACVGCTDPTQCPGTECAPAVCGPGSVCGTDPLPFPTPLAIQLPDDCVILVCDGLGGVVATPNDTEVPEPSDMLECTGDICLNGFAQPINLTNEPCTVGGVVCNAGVCVECIAPGMCPDVDPQDCLVPACSMAGACGTGPRNMGEMCMSGGGSVCDVDGNCVQCNVDMDCPLPTEECKVRDCAAEACVPANAMDGSSCTNGTCQGGVCKLSVGQPCMSPGDCLSGNCPTDDDVCCDLPCSGPCKSCATGSCLNATAGTDPQDECDLPGPMNCNGNGMCGN